MKYKELSVIVGLLNAKSYTKPNRLAYIKLVVYNLTNVTIISLHAYKYLVQLVAFFRARVPHLYNYQKAIIHNRMVVQL